jgi:hypothetical protein
MMEETAFMTLAHWANFYVIVGSSAGALTGLQFVVMTLIAEADMAGGMQVIRAFGTPTVVHFGAAFLISAVMSAPWHAFSDVGLCLAAFGALGFVYSIVVVRHARKQTDYKPDAGDWVWYAAFPLAAYAALTGAAFLLPRLPGSCLFAIAATALLFLFIGIRNAWDSVTYVTVERRRRAKEHKDETPDSDSPLA